jgi:hypothetical protein
VGGYDALVEGFSILLYLFLLCPTYTNDKRNSEESKNRCDIRKGTLSLVDPVN